MIDTALSDAINNMNDRSRDALGYDTPGAQPKFHEAMSAKAQSIGIPDPLSVAAPSLSYFVVQNHDGSRGYVRAGNFQVRDGKLLAADGRQVLGYPPDRSQGSLVPLTVPAGTPEGWVNIAADGTISVADPKALAAADLGNHFLAKTMGEHGVAALPDDAGLEVHHKAIERAKHLSTQSQGDVDEATPHVALPHADAGMSTLQPSSSLPESKTSMPRSNERNPASELSAALAIPPETLDPIGASGVLRTNETPTRLLRNQAQLESNDAQNIATDRIIHTDDEPSIAGKSSHEGNIPGRLTGADAPAFGKPIGKLALARFGLGTIVDNQGVPSSRVPIELGAPASGGIGALRTNSRDLGSVDLMQATHAIANASQVLSAIMTAEQSRNSRAKAAMGLIK